MARFVKKCQEHFLSFKWKFSKLLESFEFLFSLTSCIASDLVRTLPLVSLVLTLEHHHLLRVLFNFKTCNLTESLYSLLTGKSLQFSLLSWTTLKSWLRPSSCLEKSAWMTNQKLKLTENNQSPRSHSWKISAIFQRSDFFSSLAFAKFSVRIHQNSASFSSFGRIFLWIFSPKNVWS